MTDLPEEEREAFRRAFPPPFDDLGPAGICTCDTYPLPIEDHGEECAVRALYEGWMAHREYSKQREQETRLALDKVCALMAVSDCSECQGDGIDYEGDEWCVCECVLSKQREEVPTHFEWPEHYEVGDVQTTACEIPLEGRDHTSYRKEVTCVACLQTMLAAALAENGDSEPHSEADDRRYWERRYWDRVRKVESDLCDRAGRTDPAISAEAYRIVNAEWGYNPLENLLASNFAPSDPGGLGDRRPGA